MQREMEYLLNASPPSKHIRRFESRLIRSRITDHGSRTEKWVRVRVRLKFCRTQHFCLEPKFSKIFSFWSWWGRAAAENFCSFHKIMSRTESNLGPKNVSALNLIADRPRVHFLRTKIRPSAGQDFELILSADSHFLRTKKLSADNLAIPVRRPGSDMIEISMI